MTEPANKALLMEMADLLRPSVIRATATLGVLDRLEAAPAAPQDVARDCGTRADMTDALLRYLALLGLVEADEQGAYHVTQAGRPLLKDDPESVRPYLIADGLIGRGDMALVGLHHTLRTGEPAHAHVFGQGYWETVNGDVAFADRLADNHTERLLFDGHLVLDAYDWSRVRHVVDVGGHTGTMLLNLARRHPHLRGTLVDLGNAARIAAKNFTEAGLADRCEALVGSFFDPLPEGGDVYLLSAILADWSDEDAVRILRRCGQAAGPDGKVLLAEITLDLRASEMPMPGEELRLLATVPRPVRTTAELAELGRAAGLRVTWEGPVTPVRSMLEFSAEPDGHQGP